MIGLAIGFAFIGTALGVAVVLSLLLPAPDPHLVRIRQMGAASGSREHGDAASFGRRRPIGFMIQDLAERVGLTMLGKS